MNIQDAKNYIEYGIKLGYWDPEQFEDMTDKELIDFANYQDSKANSWAEQMIENGVDL